ncbi:hypothetical protein J32TS6_38990 [Virgibacillus pantothenticus]|nr:ATP-grasp domain-containing protein [Virgibacillus pantothenticus]GIP65344.1 hypothetical protein J32TS6_38990 [Virgibacillus pantothenticus]
MKIQQDAVLLINRFPYWVYNDSGYPFENVEKLCILQSHETKFDFPVDKYCAVVICDLNNKDAVDDAIEFFYKNYKFSKIINVTERYMELAATKRVQYGLPGMDIEMAKNFRDKISMKNKVKENSIPVPYVEKISNQKDAENFVMKYGKSVIKPIDGMGTKDTFIVNSASDIPELDLSNQYEIEKFIKGDMYHCDSVVLNGEVKVCSVSRYLNSTLNYSVDGYLASIMIDDSDLIEKMRQFNQEVISALNFKNGVTHLEVFYDSEEDSIVFCEIGARSGGAGVIPSVKYVYGVDLTETYVRLQLEEEITIPKAKDTYAGWVVIHKKEGIITEISNEDEFNFDWVLFKSINGKPGDVIKRADNSVASIADFTIIGNSEKDLKNKVNMLRNSFKLNAI